VTVVTDLVGATRAARGRVSRVATLRAHKRSGSVAVPPVVRRDSAGTMRPEVHVAVEANLVAWLRGSMACRWKAG
jgi:hypothetical protein